MFVRVFNDISSALHGEFVGELIDKVNLLCDWWPVSDDVAAQYSR